MYKVKYFVTDLQEREIESATTYTSEDFATYVAAAEWLANESDGFVDACTIDTTANPECIEVADDLKVVRIAPRGENDPIIEISFLAGIKVEAAVQEVTEYRNDLHFQFDGNDYQWTQFVGEGRGVVEYWSKDGVTIAGGDTDIIEDILGEDICDLFNSYHGINCDHAFHQECRRCGKAE